MGRRNQARYAFLSLLQTELSGFSRSASEIENEDIKMLLDVRVLWGQRSPPSGTNPSRIPRLVLRRPPPNSQQPNPPSPGSQPSSTQRVHRYIRTCDNQAQWVKVTRNRQRPNVWAPDPMPFVMRRARNKASL